jgi:hypothetical protein
MARQITSAGYSGPAGYSPKARPSDRSPARGFPIDTGTETLFREGIE